MRRLSLPFAFLAFLLLVPATRVHAFDDWLPITEEDKKITAETEKGADAIILYHEETCDDNSRHCVVYKRVKVLTEKGKKYGSIEIPYDAAYAGISDVKARTVTPGGAYIPFSGKTYNTTVIKGHGVKYSAKTFSMPSVEVGSIIEWKYSEYWEEFLIAPHWVLQDDLPQKRAKFAFVPYAKGHEVVDSRGDTKDRIFYTVIGLPDTNGIKNIADKRLELELKDIPAFQEEEFAPPSRVLKMRVNFYYGTSKMLKPQEFWKEEGKYWSREVDKFIGSPSAVSSSLAEVVAPSDTAEQKLRKIYSHVQKFKNLTYESRDRALEDLLARDSKEKISAESVLHKRAGRRDEITRAFIALARAAGIQTYDMRVSDRDEYFFQPGVPNVWQLTSEVAVAMVDGKEIFLDPGTPLCPYGLLAWQHNSTQGLRQMAGGATEIASTPKANYKDAVSKRVGRLTLSDDGAVHGQLAIAWAGVEALEHRLAGYTTDEAGRKKQLEDEVHRVMPPGAAVELLKVNNWDNPDAQLSATFKVDVPSFASSTGKRLLVPSYLFQGARTQPFTGAQRKSPVYFNYPYYTIDDVQITFPSGLRTENLPQTAPLRTDFSLYKVQRSVSGNTITLGRDFAVAGIAFIQDDYPALRKFFDGVTTGDSEPVVLTSAQ